MSEVSCKACSAFLRALAEYQISPERLVEGLPVTPAYLQNPANRISLDTYIAISRQFAALIEGVSPEAPVFSPTPQWQSVLDNIDIAIATVSPEGKILYANRSQQRLNRGTQEGKFIYEHFPEVYHQRLQRSIQTVISESQPTLTEILMHDETSGQDFWVESRMYPMPGPGVIVYNIVVTDRKRFEQELQRRAVQLQLVAEVSTQISTVLEPDQLIKNVCDLTRDSFGLYHVHIFLMDDTKTRLMVQGGSGKVGDQLAATKQFFNLDPGQHGIVPRAAREQRIIVTNDTEQDETFLYLPLLPDTRSEMAIPLLIGNRLLGVMDLQATRPNAFTEDDMRVYQTLAAQIAVAIHNAQLYEDVYRQRAVAQSLHEIGLAVSSSHDLPKVFRRILQEIDHILPYSAASIWLENDKGLLAAVATEGYDRYGVEERIASYELEPNTTRFLSTMYQTGGVIIVPDVRHNRAWGPLEGWDWVGSWAAAPIIVRGKMVGRVTLEHEQAGFYQPGHEPILQALTQQISLAIENADLFRAEREQREIAETLRDIALALSSRLELDDVLQLVLAQVSRVLPFDAAGIWLSNDGGQTFRVAAKFGYERFAAQDAVEELVFRSDDRQDLMFSEVVVVSDTQAKEDWIVYEGFEWIRSWAAAPIMVDNQIIGQVAFDHSQPGFYHEVKHKSILESLATQVSMAVGNARLFEAERRRRQEIEAVQRVGVSLTASLDLSAVLNAILEAAFDLTDAQVAYIFLYDHENDQLTPGGALEQHHGERVTASLRQPRPEGLTYTVARSAKSILIEDVHEHAIYDQKPADWFTELSAIMGIPLLIGNRVVGVMNLTFRNREALRRVEMNALQLLVDQASIAIENANLYRDVQNDAAKLESRVQQRTTELESERAQLGAILDGMAEGVIYNEGPKVIYTNQMFTALTGCRQEDVADFADLIQLISAPSVDSHELAHAISKAVQQAKGWKGEVRLRHRGGHMFDASIISTPIQSTTGVVTIFRDISQEKALQAQKDRFISNASHELRTPLANLMTRLYLMKKTPERTPEHIEIMEAVAAQMSHLVDDLLDFSRYQRGALPIKRTQMVLQDVLNEVVNIQHAEAQRKNISLEATLPSAPIAANLDAKRIRQVFTNLIVNAINYTDEGGIIRVGLSVDERGLATVRIVDNGIGIAREQLGLIFEPFFRAKEGLGIGTGLGLSISKEIVEAHGGRLEVESEEGKGSIFIVRLPLHESRALQAANE